MERWPPWSGWSVRRRIVTLSTGLLVTAMALGIAGFATALDLSLYASARDAARSQTSDIAAVLSADPRDVAAVLADTPSRGSLIQVIDGGGRVVAFSDPDAAREPLTPRRPGLGAVEVEQASDLTGEVGEPYAVVAQGIRAPGGAPYTLVVAAPLDVDDSVRTAVILLGIGAIGLLALLIFLIDRVVTGALGPVERIRADVDTIQRVRGHDRVTVPSTGDEVARLAETMNRMLGRLEQADAANRRFVADASHELRSPLATIRAAAEIAALGSGRIDGDSGAEVADDDLITVISAETQRMQGLVDSLLTLAKADDQGLLLTLGDVDLDDIVDGAAKLLRASGELSVTTSISPARVVGDASRIDQVVRNLTDNARRHAGQRIHLSVWSDPEHAWVTVEDDGPGIPVEDRERVFERFVRLDVARERDSGGSGLGLAIVASVVRAHRGDVRVLESTEGWCRVEVRLPHAGPGPTSTSWAPGSAAPAHDPDQAVSRSR